MVEAEKEKLQAVIRKLLGNRERINILEAGCGSVKQISISGNTHIVGIDISKEQLERNAFIDEKIVGNIETHDLPAEEFDMIISWNVLEHLRKPEKALQNFLKAVKKGGLIILALPNILSAKGLMTKYTPHWFHVLVYRYAFGHEWAGQEGRGPFPTFLKFSISPNGIKKFALKNNLSIEYSSMYEGGQQKKLGERHRVWMTIWRIFCRIIQALSLGRISAAMTEYIVVLRKGQDNRGMQC